MNILLQMFAAIQDYAWRIFWVGAVLSVIEMALPRSQYSWISRARGLQFWSVYVLITASALTLFSSMWSRLGFHPWYTLHIADWFKSEYFVVRASGWILAPLLAAIFSEFFYYWFHRLQHRVSFLWRFHRVHHSIREMSAWNSYHHVSEEIFRIPFVVLPLALLISPDAGQISLLIGLALGMQGLFEHSCTRFNLGFVRYIIADNRFHRIHHSIEEGHLNKNFGSFTSIWDSVFRTSYFPRSDEWPETGIADVQEPTAVSEFLLMPFQQVQGGALSAERFCSFGSTYRAAPMACQTDSKATSPDFERTRAG